MSAWRSVRFFRRARPATPAWNVAKTALQIAAFWSVFLLVIPQALVIVERTLTLPSLGFPPRWAWGVFIVASALGLWSGAAMAWHGAGTPLPLDAPRYLVLRGPYRYVRNPMALAGVTQGACVGLILDSWLSLAFAAAGAVVWNYVVRPVEERDLESEFGAAYTRYREAVRCWIPRFPGYRYGA